MLDSDTVSVDDVTHQIELLFRNSADATLQKCVPKKTAKSKAKQTWFDPQCKESRINYRRSKDAYRRNKSAANFEDMQRSSKEYKRSISKAKSKSKKSFLTKLRNMKATDPKAYWKMLNVKAQSKSPAASLDAFFEHFKTLNLLPAEHTEGCHNVQGVDVTLGDLQDTNSLDMAITQEEIVKVVKSLKNGKAAGIDGINNEYLKCTIDKLAPVYEKLFNLVLSTGDFPKAWAVALVVPIYKSKGDPKNPDNYRGISLLSCLGKVFTAILNTRLSMFADDNCILSENQAGFRKKYSTVDHVFTLKSLIDMYLAQKKKVFCAFVDYAKAFDSIWRVGLWHKLVQSNISGRVLRVLKNLYSGIKSCVLLNGSRSDFFSCMTGVRQGENLSPFLFSIFVNDMEEFFAQKGVPYVELQSSDLNCMLKLMIVLYADDTVIIAETAAGLQKSLDALQDYCKTWKLNVNISKTKVLIFCKRKVNPANYNFVYGGKAIDLVSEFKYLGVLFHFNGSFCGSFV